MNGRFIQRAIRALTLGTLFTQTVLCRGQSGVPASIGGVIVPEATGTLGKQDPAAMEELAAHRSAVGTTAGWSGMQGTGTMTFGTQDTASYQATLSNLGADMFRLDLQAQNESTSIRIRGSIGKIQANNATGVPMPMSAALAGIFPFERLRIIRVSAPSMSIIDHGMVNVDGVELHRLTLESEAIGRVPIKHSRSTIAMDCYFDPSTHLLTKSAILEPAPSGRQANFLIVATYSDYRKVGDSMVPFHYTETMDGQPYSTLQLSAVQLDPPLTSTYFEF